MNANKVWSRWITKPYEPTRGYCIPISPKKSFMSSQNPVKNVAIFLIQNLVLVILFLTEGPFKKYLTQILNFLTPAPHNAILFLNTG